MKNTLALISCIALQSASSAHPYLQEEFVQDTCPPCELLFRKLEPSGQDGKMSQVVRVQLRGEPKSGTGMAFDWATGALAHACDYLNQQYGEASCRLDIVEPPEDIRAITFQPALGRGKGPCSCDTVDSATISITANLKHTLPTEKNCSYSHPPGIVVGSAYKHKHHGDACGFKNGSRVHNLNDLWQCISQANCPLTDDRLQMAVLRDPRPVAVSAYYHQTRSGKKKLGTMEDFTIRELPLMCQWVAIRYILFSGWLPHQSELFWYHDALTDPLAWHYRWFDFVGLQLPRHVMNETADAAIENDFTFEYKHIDAHPGQENVSSSDVRQFEDEVGPETIEIADAILRQWLPPVLLAKLGL